MVKAGGCEKHSRSGQNPRPLDEFWRKLLTLETKGKGMTVGEPTSCKKSKVSIYTCMYVIYVYNSIYLSIYIVTVYGIYIHKIELYK